MKPKDYMVGDWIATEHDFPMQVTAVGKDYLYADFKGNEGDVFEFDDKYLPKPIPLTEEILEKNGFCKVYDEDVIIYRKICRKKTIEIEVGINYEINKDGGFYLSRILHRLYYVHQLQHALSLCGLEELANNIKI